MPYTGSLRDIYGRKFPYLRLSLTDVCNFRCQYCLPGGYRNEFGKIFLKHTEIYNLITAFTAIGLRKVRLTGGEPTVRKDFLSIGNSIATFKSVEELVFTTNGYTLETIAYECVRNCFTGVNVSVDSLDGNMFRIITGRDCLKKIIYGVDCALSVGLKTKVNVVLLNCFTCKNFDEYIDFVSSRSISVRFIELTGVTGTLDFFKNNYTSSLFLKNYLLSLGWRKRKCSKTDGPAVEYEHEDYKGFLGFISSYSSDFCLSCNRLRISSIGSMYLCLFGSTKKVITLRHLLQSSTKKLELINYIKENVLSKGLSHSLLQGNLGSVVKLSEIGG